MTENLLARTLVVCVAIGVLLAGATAASSAARSALVVGSGDLVFFSGSDFQCLGFGPAAAQKGGAGIVCWQGPPRQLLELEPK
jgi:hypothetical protein